METARSCDLCGGEDWESLSRRDRRGDPLETVVCRACGLVAHAHIPSDDELARYYGEQYRQDYHGEFTPSPYRVVREWRRGQELVAALGREVAPGGRVVEIGSGIGCTVMSFALAGFDAWGVEPGEGFSRFSRETLGARVQVGTLADVPPTGDHDLALLVHVLEHLPSPTAALRRIAGLLRPEGRLYVEVPNFGRPHAAPGREFHYAHIYNFTAATLAMLAAKTGFRVVRHRFRPRGGVLGMVLEKSPDATFAVDPGGYALTMAAARRYSWLTYYGRPHYWCRRLLVGLERGCERWGARRKMERIVARCQSAARGASDVARAA